jgi:hypothetical protein
VVAATAANFATQYATDEGTGPPRGSAALTILRLAIALATLRVAVIGITTILILRPILCAAALLLMTPILVPLPPVILESRVLVAVVAISATIVVAVIPAVMLAI